MKYLEKFINDFTRITNDDIDYEHNFRDMIIPPGIFSIPLNIKEFSKYYSWLIEDRNNIFDNITLNYNKINNTNNDDLKRLKLNIKSLQETKRSIEPISRVAKIKNRRYSKHIMKIVNLNKNKNIIISSINNLNNQLEKDVIRLEMGDRDLENFIYQNSIVYNYHESNRIYLAKTFFNRRLNPGIETRFQFSTELFCNMIRSDIDILDIINTIIRNMRNRTYRIFISFDIIMERKPKPIKISSNKKNEEDDKKDEENTNPNKFIRLFLHNRD